MVNYITDKVWCKVGGAWKQTFMPKVYAVDIAVKVADPYDRVTYPQTVTIGGQVYNNACYGYTPASGTNLNSWATDYDSGTGLISGIVPGTLTDGVFTVYSSKTTIPEGSSSADAMTYFPTWYQYWNNDGETIRIICCQEQLTSDFKDYPGSIRTTRYGHFCLGCYTCTSSYHSQVGTPDRNMSYSTFLDGCQGIGINYDMMTWFQYQYLVMLCVFIWKSTDLQTAFAGGYVGGSSFQTNIGLSTNQYGMKGTPGTDTTERMAFFWIADLWGNLSQFVGGIHIDSNYHVELNTGPSDVFNWNLQTSQGPGTYVFNHEMRRAVGMTESGFFPLTGDDSTSTYYSDRVYVNKDTFGKVGGDFNDSDSAGPFYVFFNYKSGSSDAYTGSRLSYRGDVTMG